MIINWSWGRAHSMINADVSFPPILTACNQMRMRRVGICKRVIITALLLSPPSPFRIISIMTRSTPGSTSPSSLTPFYHNCNQVNPWEYFINRERKFVWCNVFKSASSSWMYGFNDVAIR